MTQTTNNLSIDEKMERVADTLYNKQLELKEEYITVDRKVVKAVEEMTNEQAAQLASAIINKIASYGHPNICHILSKQFKTGAFSNIKHWDFHIRTKIFSALKEKIYNLPDNPEFDHYFFIKEVNEPNRRLAMKYVRAITANALHYTFGGESTFRSDFQYKIHKDILFLACLFEHSKVANNVSLYKLLSLDHFKQLVQDEKESPFTYEKSIQYLQDASFKWYQEFKGMIDFVPSTVHYKDVPQYLHLFTEKQIIELKEVYIQAKFEAFETYQTADKLTLPLLQIIKGAMNQIDLWSINDGTYNLENDCTCSKY